MKNQKADVTWRDGMVPVSARFDDPYFSLQDGLAETCHVFLDGNDLAQRLVKPLHIAELGFGTGLNFLATLKLRQEIGAAAALRFTSFEAFPLASSDMEKALAQFPALEDLAKPLIAGVNAGHTEFEMPGNVWLSLELGDARTRLPEWSGAADAWFLDGFSPAKNPELWSAPLMGEVGRHTAPGGTFATYTAAGFVRRGLQDAGFAVERVAGYGRKRHMTRGTLR